ncbi:MAG: AraC family transcriptional regulator [Saprospiraceae bacterium]|nr:AraC family transcriptional regulator [Saprospiraceae bacterium]
METINILIVLQALLWSSLLLSSRLKTIEKYSLSIIMIMCALIQLTVLILPEGYGFLLSDILNISFIFIITSFISLFILQLTISIKSPFKSHLFILPLIVAFFNALTWLFNEAFSFAPILLISYALILIYVFYTLLTLLIRVYKKRQFSGRFFDDSSLYISSLLLSFAVILIVILPIIIFLFNVVDFNFNLGTKLWFDLIMAIGMFLIGYLSITKQFKEQNNQAQKLKKKVIISENPDKQILIENAFKQDKIHLDNELTIDKLAYHLSMDTTELSSILNHEMNTNFYQLINSYRVEEVKKKLQEDDQRFFTLLAIAFDCGFNSKSTFNRVFKEFTGVSPKEFKDGLK